MSEKIVKSGSVVLAVDPSRSTPEKVASAVPVVPPPPEGQMTAEEQEIACMADAYRETNANNLAEIPLPPTPPEGNAGRSMTPEESEAYKKFRLSRSKKVSGTPESVSPPTDLQKLLDELDVAVRYAACPFDFEAEKMEAVEQVHRARAAVTEYVEALEKERDRLRLCYHSEIASRLSFKRAAESLQDRLNEAYAQRDEATDEAASLRSKLSLLEAEKERVEVRETLLRESIDELSAEVIRLQANQLSPEEAAAVLAVRCGFGDAAFVHPDVFAASFAKLRSLSGRSQ